MENNHKIIIILLIVIIAILVLCLGTLTFQKAGNEECELKITCLDKMFNGEKVKIELMDSNGTPIADAKIHIKLERDNNVSEYDVTTNSEGTATLSLDDLKDGNYAMTCTFDGNSKYGPANSAKSFKYDSHASTSSDISNDADSIEANRPKNDPNYKGYNPRHESEPTSDGWNPREHEVSRENMGDGRQRINYDDGYYTLVDSNGYVINYGFR